MASVDFEPRRVPAGARANGEAPAVRIAQLYEQHGRMVRALCRVMLRDPAEAEDAAQQTFLSAFASLIDGTEPQRPSPWLATIARRECWARAAQRRRRPLAVPNPGETAEAPETPLEAAIRNADLAALWRAIDGLPKQQRDALLMREFSGLSYSEVAAALGASESAIESLLVRARRHLRDGLGAVNLALTPLALLHHRLARLVGSGAGKSGGAAATAGLPAAMKVLATVASFAAAGAAGLGVAVVASRPSAAHASNRSPAEYAGRSIPVAVASPLEPLPGGAVAAWTAAARLVPSAETSPAEVAAAEAIAGAPAGSEPAESPTEPDAPGAPADPGVEQGSAATTTEATSYEPQQTESSAPTDSAETSAQTDTSPGGGSEAATTTDTTYADTPTVDTGSESVATDTTEP